MKYFILCLILLSTSVFGQVNIDAKRDFIWGLSNCQGANYQRSYFNFNSNPFQLFIKHTSIYHNLTNSSICDENGNLLFYTNGMRVCDSTGQMMPNGDSLSFGDIYQNIINSWYGYPVEQGALTLPLPGSNHLYYIFHEKANWYNAPTLIITPGVQYSMVDMNLHEGLGDILVKNQTLIRDTVNYGMMTAVRHANGRDWWILVPGFFTSVYHRILLTPSGLSSFKQTIPAPPATIPEVGHAVFTPDGTKYIRCGAVYYNEPFRLEIFSFDRCTGILSNYQDLTGLCDSTLGDPSVAVSQDSRFLYVTNGMTIYQFDLLANNIPASKMIVATYDNFYWVGNSTYFSTMQLAPDHKIYIGAGGTPYVHVINHPDIQGVGCDVQQHGIQLAYRMLCGLPNFPNFRLGPLAGSPCDSLFNAIDENIAVNNLTITAYPNPASSQITFNLNNFQHHGNYKIMIFNSLGQMIGEIPLSSYQSTATFNTDFLSNGLYQAVLWKGEEKVSWVKFVVQQ